MAEEVEIIRAFPFGEERLQPGQRITVDDETALAWKRLRKAKAIVDPEALNKRVLAK